MEKLPQTITEFERLLSMEKIEHRHLEALSPDEKEAFKEMVYDTLARLSGRPLDVMVEKTQAILDNEFIWEYNHNKITEGVHEYMRQYGSMPTMTHLAATCGLNRKTVSEHIGTFNSNEALSGRKEAMNIMRENVMNTVIKAAIRGNLKAAKLYLDATKSPVGTETMINNQNNYIEINKTVINQQIIQQLKPEQLKQIELIITGTENKPEE